MITTTSAGSEGVEIGTPWILVSFHTQEGQTAKIANRIAHRLRQDGAVVDVFDVDAAPAPAAYDIAVIGDSIHTVHHSAALTRYVKRHVDELNVMPSALFQVSLTSANLDAEHADDANEMVMELLDRTGFEPDVIAMFAGALLYSKYGWFKRRIMRHIVRQEAGDTDMTRDYEYTDWDAVNRFALDVRELVPQVDRAAATDSGKNYK